MRLHGPLHTSYGAERRSMVSTRRCPSWRCRRRAPSSSSVRHGQRAVPFDLDHGPLVRVHVSATGPNETSDPDRHAPHQYRCRHLRRVVGPDRRPVRDGGPLPELPIALRRPHRCGNGARSATSHGALLAATVAAAPSECRALGLAAPRPAEPDGYLSAPRSTSAADLPVGPAARRSSVAMAAAAVVLSRFPRYRSRRVRHHRFDQGSRCCSRSGRLLPEHVADGSRGRPRRTIVR